jgi:hypothetical protein
MKRQSLAILFAIIGYVAAWGQYRVDAGNDTIICASGKGIPVIGGHPTVSGGLEPYKYSWSAYYKMGSTIYGASYFLDDTTKANPQLIHTWLAPAVLTFKVTATDMNGSHKTDSIHVRYSSFIALTIQYVAFIHSGDTAFLNHPITGGIKPLRTAWEPRYNISDTSTFNPKAWPDTTTGYRAVVIDSIGCISGPYTFWVFVTPLGITNIEDLKYQSTVFPNPVDINSVIRIERSEQGDLKVRIVKASGQLVLVDKMTGDSYRVGNKLSSRGLYFYVISREDEMLSQGRFIIR